MAKHKSGGEAAAGAADAPAPKPSKAERAAARSAAEATKKAAAKAAKAEKKRLKKVAELEEQLVTAKELQAAVNALVAAIRSDLAAARRAGTPSRPRATTTAAKKPAVRRRTTGRRAPAQATAVESTSGTSAEPAPVARSPRSAATTPGARGKAAG